MDRKNLSREKWDKFQQRGWRIWGNIMEGMQQSF